jgi:glycosyltransferase involved in cell wall biosynthesis
VVGGLGNHVRELVPALARHGIEVHLVTPRWAGGEPKEVVVETKLGGAAIVHRVDPPTSTMANFFADAQQTNLNLGEAAQELFVKIGPLDATQGKPFDLIHAHDWLVAFAACSLKRMNKVPLLATIHATERGRGHGTLHSEISQAINGVEWWLTYEAWRVICCSRFMANEVTGYFQVPADKIDVVPNGVNTAPFDALDVIDLTAFRSRFAAPSEKIVFSVGRLVYEKGIHLLVEAVPRVLASFPKAKFVVAGTGGLLDGLKTRADALGVGAKIFFTGFIPDEDRDRLFKVADCAVFPSLYEPFGIVALEAMAARCPVVVADVGGLSEVAQLHETGITVYPDNPDSLAWGIVHTLAHPDWSRARAENAYRRVVQDYSWARIAAHTIAIYERIIDEQKHTGW